MNAYQKWGWRFIARLMRNLATTLSLWGAYEVKYREFNWQDALLALAFGCLLPTLREFFAAGVPKEICGDDDLDAPIPPPAPPASPVPPPPPAPSPS